MIVRRKSYWLVATLLTLSLLALLNYHVQNVVIPISWQAPINFLAFAWLIVTISLAHSNDEFKVSPESFYVCVVAPVFNEDPITFRAMLESLDNQTRKPDFIYISDDGSKSKDCRKAFNDWRQHTVIPSRYYKHANRGKREAQAVAFRNIKADIFVTIDSDTVLDEEAIEKGIAPFANPKVMSVAGLLLGLNYNKNLLTRLTEIGFVTSFLNGRAAWSRMRSVAVNCGGLALYRSSVVKKYLHEYTHQTVFGNLAKSGDDRMLTNFALLEGWTVYQQGSVGYTLLPVKIKHLLKQRIRWWRSFFWGGVWLLGRFTPKRIVWWLVLWQFISFVLYTIVVIAALILIPFIHHTLPLAYFVYVALLAYVRNARYLSLKRPDQTFVQQISMYALSPLSTLLYFFLCTVLQYIGLATVKDMGWNTRQNNKVEVAME